LSSKSSSKSSTPAFTTTTTSTTTQNLTPKYTPTSVHHQVESTRNTIGTSAVLQQQSNQTKRKILGKVQSPTTLSIAENQFQSQKPLTSSLEDGYCMSLWQPWASLLVYGIKLLEGRTWNSEFRGILWIAAATKKPSQDEIEALKALYLSLGHSSSKFPEFYPTGVLLGCVNVIDVITQQQYQEQEMYVEPSESPYIFVCGNARRLAVPLPVKGDHKIWKLPKKTLESAKAGLVT